uniref:Inositol phosphatase domain-containing protein n=1 Tax=Romanomermis culicivorax TaxID=13658 RepID=A0A915KYU6_ROMCU
MIRNSCKDFVLIVKHNYYKGDFTRTGQRKLVGILKDGYNSASRYYMCHLRDRNRQKAIDVVLGNIVDTDEKIDLKLIQDEQSQQDSEWQYQKDEQMRQLIEDCLKAFLPVEDTLFGCWPLVDVCDLVPQNGTFTENDLRILDASDSETNIILILTQRCVYFIKYNENEDEFNYCHKINIDQLMSVEMGKFVIHGNKAVFRKGEKSSKVPYIRIWYRVEDCQDYCYILKSAGIRIFNNIPIAVQSPHEFDEYTNSIFEQFRSAIWLNDLSTSIPVGKSPTLEFKKFNVFSRDNSPMENLLSSIDSQVDFVTSPIDVNLIQLDDWDNSDSNDQNLAPPSNVNRGLKTSRSENFLKVYKSGKLASTSENSSKQETPIIKGSSSSNQFLDKLSDSRKMIKSMGLVLGGPKTKKASSENSLMAKYGARINSIYVQIKIDISMKKIWKSLFGRHLLLTNVIGGTGLAYLGDYTRQKTSQKFNGEINYEQSRSMAVVSIPLSLEMHFWYKFLDHVFPTKSKIDVLRKVICDEIIMAPNFTFSLISGLSFMEKLSWTDYRDRLKKSFGTLYLMDVAFFTPIQFLNFYFFPTKYRTLLLYSAAILYYYVASFILYE